MLFRSEVQFADIAESQPELLARHCTEAGLIEKATSLWGKAGQRSLARSALVEAAEQLSRALGQIATVPATSASRREQIKLQVALINALFHVKGYAAPETKAAVEQGRLLIEEAKALGEAPEDPLLLFSVLFGLWVANLVAFDSEACIDLAKEFLSLAEKEGTTGPLMVGHQMLGLSLQTRGDMRPSPVRSGDCSVQPCGAWPAGDAVWPRQPSAGVNSKIGGPVAARLSRRRLGGR